MNASRARIQNLWEQVDLEDHIFLLSSGTTTQGMMKTYAIAKKSFRENAKSVNRFLNSSSLDNWLISLPHFHVGGLAIFARAFESGASTFSFTQSWDPVLFLRALEKNKIHFCSLVPTQLYDLVQKQLSPCQSLKGVFIGGDYASRTLLNKALELGWPIIETYGMTELSSQIASQFYEKDLAHLEILDIHRIFTEDDKTYIESPSLFTMQMNIFDNSFEVLTASSKFLIPDKVELKTIAQKNYLKVLGRRVDSFKINGRLFNARELKDSFETFLFNNNLFSQVAFKRIDDPRSGNKLLVLIEKVAMSEENKVIRFMSDDLGLSSTYYEIRHLDAIPRTELGKIKL